MAQTRSQARFGLNKVLVRKENQSSVKVAADVNILDDEFSAQTADATILFLAYVDLVAQRQEWTLHS